MKLVRAGLLGSALCAIVFSTSEGVDGGRQAPTTLFIVRHTEKVGESSKAQLSNAGRERARTLTWMLRDVAFDAVYSTDVARTRDTVAAIAEANGKELSFYSPRQGSLGKAIEGKHCGQTVLIGGHSNTVPALLAELGTPIKDKILPGYDDLFIVTIDPASGATMRRLHYPGTH